MRCSLRWALALSVVSLTAGGCAVRSISDAGYRAGGSSPIYRGELHDLDILDLGSAAMAEATLRGDVTLRRNQRVLVVQSGAMMPDEEMLSALSSHFQVGTLSGIPRDAGSDGSYRLAAARGGYEAILCYWGVLESARAETAGKALRWVPVAGLFIPDESQYMRIRLKLLVLDVATGAWTMLMPKTAADNRESSLVTRASNDQEQVLQLKAEGYAIAVAQLVEQLVR